MVLTLFCPAGADGPGRHPRGENGRELCGRLAGLPAGGVRAGRRQGGRQPHLPVHWAGTKKMQQKDDNLKETLRLKIYFEIDSAAIYWHLRAVLPIRIPRIHMCLGLPDPDPDPFIIKQ